MSKINVMVNGLPGNVATVIAQHIISDQRFTLIPYSLTGPEIDTEKYLVDGVNLSLIRPDMRQTVMDDIITSYVHLICIDFTHPTSVNSNAQFYCGRSIPFVMGTTGGDREALLATVENSGVAAVIAPNMAKQIVGFQAMMAWAADTFPGLFNGYAITIRESHQKGKADTSGTAKSMVGYFNKLGPKCLAEDIEQERDPEKQSIEWGIPEEHLTGHGWHTYTLTSDDQTVKFQFTHNVNGREIYARGTLDAVMFLYQRVQQGVRGKVFSMMDVIKTRSDFI
jgi:4-hydroxy-tetrahydrodipicolinate reductase